MRAAAAGGGLRGISVNVSWLERSRLLATKRSMPALSLRASQRPVIPLIPLRHTAATPLLNERGNQRDVQALLGHISGRLVAASCSAFKHIHTGLTSRAMIIPEAVGRRRFRTNWVSGWLATNRLRVASGDCLVGPWRAITLSGRLPALTMIPRRRLFAESW